MNPQVKQIVRAIPIVVGTVAILFLWDYIRSKLSEHMLDQLDGVIVYVVIAGAFVVGILAVGYVFSNFFYEVYTETILQRASHIMATAVDEKEEYLYVAASCYQSGEESGAGFYIERYYLFELATGKRFLYQAKHTHGAHDSAIIFFNTILKKDKPIQFKMNETVSNDFQTKNYEIKITAFRTKIDFGYQINCRNKETKVVTWEKKI